MTEINRSLNELTPAELRPIVMAWGGVDSFAAIIHAKPRTVYAWLAGDRRIRPLQAGLIRSLRPPSSGEAA